MKISVLFVLCLSVFAAASFVLNCTPELSGSVDPGIYNVSVVANEPVIGAGSFIIRLAPNGAFTWHVPTEIIAVSWTHYEEMGIHYWIGTLDSPVTVIPNPIWESDRITFSFPEPGSSFELALLNDSFDMLESRSFTITPEPATLLTLALGAVCLTKKRPA